MGYFQILDTATGQSWFGNANPPRPDIDMSRAAFNREFLGKKVDKTP
jgi:hypothetical protein